MANATQREIHLKRRPVGAPGPDDFELVTTPIPSPGDGEILVRNVWMTVDPYMRGRMMDRESYIPPFQIGGVLDGGSVGEVVESHSDSFRAGDYVCGFASGGWREYYVSNGTMLQTVDAADIPLQAYLGTVGMPGLTAYAGLLRIGEPKEGETVLVSAASGAVGAIVCQIAKIKGCRVVGTAGSDAKVAWLRDEVGIDAAINYKTCDGLEAAIARECPNGVDVYFENVGGEHLEAALNLMNQHGRLAMCGMISLYNRTELPAGPPNLILIVGKSLKMQGFVVSDHLDMVGDFFGDMATWIAAGRITWKETVLEGIEHAPRAFMNLFSGENFGKMLVRLGPDRVDT